MNTMELNRSDRAVANWIIIGVAMLIIQILLGGITRLTGSGLSITEWDVITGSLPPLNEQQWLQEFHKYQQTPQYRLLNFSFNLSDFKFIFFWEWFHRLWGRLIGVVFLIPFIVFLVQKRFRPEMVKPLVILFLLGALQGAVGWIMVASGLTGDAIYVRPTKLAMHFVLACILISYAFWFALQLKISRQNIISASALKSFTWTLIVLLFIQLTFGALLAGHKGATSAPTWPDINGEFVPAYVFKQGSISIIDNPIVIQFIHRSIAYLLVILISIWTIRAYRTKASPAFAKARWIPALIVVVQLALGIFTVLTSARIRPTKWNVFEWMAQLHQLVAIFLLLSLIAMLFLVRGKRNLKTKNAVEATAI
ncbi:MAG: COX15/CtaA family protein [Flavisolibacter sp.]